VYYSVSEIVTFTKHGNFFNYSVENPHISFYMGIVKPISNINLEEFEQIFTLLLLHKNDEISKKIVIISSLFQSAFSDIKLFTSFMVIILEALFIGSSDNTELGYKFAMRQAKFFQKLGKGTFDIKVIKNWYNIRSKVLHGASNYNDPKLYKNSSFQETNELIFENVKLAIFEYIRGNLNPTKIDEEMVGNTTSSPITPKSPS
jgi:hypothetical protein